LNKEPEGPAVEVKRLLYNLRTQVLTTSHVPPILAAVVQLPEQLAQSLLRSVFGMYTDPDVAASVRNNITLTARAIWSATGPTTRAEIGVKCATFAVNGEVDRNDLGRKFLETVDGLRFLPEDVRAVEIDAALTELLNAHNGFNNFYNEPPRAQILARLVPETGSVPEAVERKYMAILTLCRIGNGYGVSREAQPIYDKLLSTFSDRLMAHFVQCVGFSTRLSSRLQTLSCARRCLEVARSFRDRTANVLIRRGLDVVLETSAQNLRSLKTHAKYQEAVRDLVLFLGE
jgi:hypothetical protein